MEGNIFPDSLPAELLHFVFSHCSLVSLMQLSATCRLLRLQVHELFKLRLSTQATAHPEVRESLTRIGWKKEHQLWTCACFKLVAGPSLAWQRLNKQDSFKIKAGVDFSHSQPPMTALSTTVVGKIFVLTFGRNIIFWEKASDSFKRPNSPASLVAFESGHIDLLASYENVLAFSRFDDKSRHSITIFNPSTLYPVTEVFLQMNGYVAEVHRIVFATGTMVVKYLAADGTLETNIDIWKIDTKNPQKEGIALLKTISHRNAPLSKYIRPYTIPYTDLCVNDRFMAVVDHRVVQVFQSYKGSGGDPLLIRQDSQSYLIDIAMEKGQGDHIAMAFQQSNKLVLKVYSAISSRRITLIEKILNPFSFLRCLEWFGEHLVILTQEGGSLSMMTWQPGMPSLLSCPLNFPVVKPTSFRRWEIDCLNVDYQGITTVFRDNSCLYSDEQMIYFQIWNSGDQTVNENLIELGTGTGTPQPHHRKSEHIGSRHHPPPPFSQPSQHPISQSPPFSQLPHLYFQPPSVPFSQPPPAPFSQPPTSKFLQPPSSKFLQPPPTPFSQPPPAPFSQPGPSFSQSSSRLFSQSPPFSKLPPLYLQPPPAPFSALDPMRFQTNPV